MKLLSDISRDRLNVSYQLAQEVAAKLTELSKECDFLVTPTQESKPGAEVKPGMANTEWVGGFFSDPTDPDHNVLSSADRARFFFKLVEKYLSSLDKAGNTVYVRDQDATLAKWTNRQAMFEVVNGTPFAKSMGRLKTAFQGLGNLAQGDGFTMWILIAAGDVK